MADTPTTEKEQLTVVPAQDRKEQLKVFDPNGNYLEFASKSRQSARSRSQKWNRDKGPMPVYVRNPAQTELCQLTVEEAAKIFLDAGKEVPEVGAPPYSFEAPVNTIPNLCNKDGQAR